MHQNNNKCPRTSRDKCPALKIESIDRLKIDIYAHFDQVANDIFMLNKTVLNTFHLNHTPLLHIKGLTPPNIVPIDALYTLLPSQ